MMTESMNKIPKALLPFVVYKLIFRGDENNIQSLAKRLDIPMRKLKENVLISLEEYWGVQFEIKGNSISIYNGDIDENDNKSDQDEFGWKWRWKINQYKLAYPLWPEEILLLISYLNNLHESMPNEVSVIIQKLLNGIFSDDREKIKKVGKEDTGLLDSSGMDFTRKRINFRPKVLGEMVSDAIKKNMVLTINYTGIDKNRNIDLIPYGIVEQNSCIYLIGEVVESKIMDFFTSDRLNNVFIKGKNTEKRKNFDIKTFLNLHFDMSPGEEITVVAKFKKKLRDAILRRNLVNGQIIKDDADEEWFTYGFSAVGLEQTARWLLKFGDECEVVEPISVRERLVEIVKCSVKMNLDQIEIMSR